jgi:membrane protease YdiL (CAAX protease family)
MKWLKKLFNKMRLIKRITLVIGLITLKVLIAGAQVSVSPSPPPFYGTLTTMLSYLQWIGIVGGVGLGALLAGIKIALQHDMEGGKRDLMYSIIGGVVISLVATVLNLFV